MSSMSPNSFSANSKKIRRFNNGRRLSMFAYLLFFILPISGSIFWYIQNRDQPEILSIPVQVASFRGDRPDGGGRQNLIPSNAVAVIESIENGGIVSAKHLVNGIDQTIISSGSTMSFDRDSWKSIDTTSGTVGAYVSTRGRVYNIQAKMSLIEGSWKISSFIVE